ncbi:MAG: hypothetical protein J2P41_08270, partial [Blastocatellia bacterium]|nr:hypothetical protein [Blastocatellia bacterium]
MNRKYLVKYGSFLFFHALIAAAVFSQSTQPAQPPAQPALEQEQPAVGPTPTPTPAEPTLNLHRWGAVTIFHGLPSDRI